MSYITRAGEFYSSTLIPFLGTAFETGKKIVWSPVRVTADYAQNKAFGHFKVVAEPTTMGLRAVSELQEAYCYAQVLWHSSNKSTPKKIDRALLAFSMAFTAIADSYLFAMRMTGRTVSPGLELTVLPARLIAAIIASQVKYATVKSTAVSQLAVVVEKASLSYSTVGYHKSAALFSGVVTIIEMIARSYFTKNTFAGEDDSFLDLVKSGWDRLRGNTIEEL